MMDSVPVNTCRKHPWGCIRPHLCNIPTKGKKMYENTMNRVNEGRARLPREAIEAGEGFANEMVMQPKKKTLPKRPYAVGVHLEGCASGSENMYRK